MKRLTFLLLLALQGFAQAADTEGFVSLFNGRDLTGWVNVNCAPETWSVGQGLIRCTGHPTGALRTVRQYENFILELEWRHLSSGGNSGIFVWSSPLAAPGVPFLRAIEVQVLDHGYNSKGKNEWYTTHGDVFPIHGSSMQPFGRHNGMRSFPSEDRSHRSPEWNHYRIVCQDGVLRLHVNGKEVSGGEKCSFRKGYFGLESEGAPVEFRNIRIQELPSSGASPEATAPLDLGWTNLFTGLDFRGWKTNSASGSGWQATGEKIKVKPGAAPSSSVLWTERAFGDAEFVVDCLSPKGEAGASAVTPAIFVRGGAGRSAQIALKYTTPGAWQRYIITVQGRNAVVQSQGDVQRVNLPADVSDRGDFGLSATGGSVEFMNLYARDL